MNIIAHVISIVHARHIARMKYHQLSSNMYKTSLSMLSHIVHYIAAKQEGFHQLKLILISAIRLVTFSDK